MKNEIIVTNQDKGQRLDLFLLKKFPDQSRAHIQKLISQYKILVDGHNCKTSYKIWPSDEIRANDELGALGNSYNFERPQRRYDRINR